jgi:hypothetical protein
LRGDHFKQEVLDMNPVDSDDDDDDDDDDDADHDGNCDDDASGGGTKNTPGGGDMLLQDVEEEGGGGAPAPVTFKRSDRVTAQRGEKGRGQGGGKFHAGVVRTANPDGSFEILFDDGEKASKVRSACMKLKAKAAPV